MMLSNAVATGIRGEVGAAVGGAGHGDDGLGDREVASARLAEDEGGEDGGAGMLGEQGRGGGKLGGVTEEAHGRA